jgi:hypothetical protein
LGTYATYMRALDGWANEIAFFCGGGFTWEGRAALIVMTDCLIGSIVCVASIRFIHSAQRLFIPFSFSFRWWQDLGFSVQGPGVPVDDLLAGVRARYFAGIQRAKPNRVNWVRDG